MTFHEYDDIGKEIALSFSRHLIKLEFVYGITFRSPKHELSRRLLNEIIEFKSADDDEKGPF